MNNKDLVSVLMSVYNESIGDLRLSIDSMINQTYENIEIVIIIDNPKNIEAIGLIKNYCNKYKNIKYYINDSNIGLVQSLNKGINYCNGKYIARMDADDISDASRIETQMKYMNENPQIDMLGTDIQFIDEKGNEMNKSRFFVNGSDRIAFFLKYANCMNHNTWLIKSNIFKDENIKGYRELTYAEDYDFVCRLCANGFKIDNLPDKLVQYRIRLKSVSRSNEYKQVLSALYTKKIYRKYLKSKKDIYDSKKVKKILASDDKIYKLSRKLYTKSRESSNLVISLYYKLLTLLVSLIDLNILRHNFEYRYGKLLLKNNKFYE